MARAKTKNENDAGDDAGTDDVGEHELVDVPTYRVEVANLVGIERTLEVGDIVTAAGLQPGTNLGALLEGGHLSETNDAGTAGE